MIDSNLFSGVKSIFVDTSSIVYLVEGNLIQKRAVEMFINMARVRDIRIFASVIAWAEIFSRKGLSENRNLLTAFRKILTDSNIFTLVPVDVAVADTASGLRAARGLTLADALQISTAKIINADLLLTNDHEWKNLPDISRVILIDEIIFAINN